jgi:hypothetical protein
MPKPPPKPLPPAVKRDARKLSQLAQTPRGKPPAPAKKGPKK